MKPNTRGPNSQNRIWLSKSWFFLWYSQLWSNLLTKPLVQLTWNFTWMLETIIVHDTPSSLALSSCVQFWYVSQKMLKWAFFEISIFSIRQNTEKTKKLIIWWCYKWKVLYLLKKLWILGKNCKKIFLTQNFWNFKKS